ncbi:MAG: heme exporter protein CcmD [Pseudomonadota bacterium]
MTELGPYAFYILGAYGLGALCIGGLFAATLFETGKIRRQLKAFEE